MICIATQNRVGQNSAQPVLFIVIKQLLSFGYDVKFGEDVLVNEECMGIPNDNILKENMQRAVSQGADPHLVENLRNYYQCYFNTAE